jgi:alanyl-tRNA synthetase
LGYTKPFMTGLLPSLEATMGRQYPELVQRRVEIARAILAEEESFSTTLDRGLALFEDVVGQVSKGKDKVFPGADAFRLYDTYGFPLDLTVVMAKERGLTVDEARFALLMEEQRKRARDARKAAATDADADLVADLVARGVKTKFIGYSQIDCQTVVLEALIRREGGGSALGECLDEGMEGALLVKETPFYAEKGGQLGDHGVISCASGEFEVIDTRQPAEGIVLHIGRMVRGSIGKGVAVTAKVNDTRRAAVARHHTATHLLQHALRDVVGNSIKQSGSMVGPDRLRFDFAYFQALTAEQIAAVERRVNEMIIENDKVTTSEMPLKDVAGSGIIALFDEKYGETVRVVSVGGYSRELCGGTHVTATGTIGLFRILSESSIASGVRRIEAVAGMVAYDAMCEDRKMVDSLAKRFSVAPSEVSDRVDAVAEQIKQLEKRIKEQENAAAMLKLGGILAAASEVNGVMLTACDVGEVSSDGLKSLAESALAKLGSGVVTLGAVCEGKVQFIVAVSADLVKKGVHAGKIVKEVAKVAGGSGGGQPAMARAGGKDAGKVAEAVEVARGMVNG